MPQVPRKGPIRVATEYPLVAELLTSPAFQVTDRSDEASADVLIALRPVRDFYALPRSVVFCAVFTSQLSQRDETHKVRGTRVHMKSIASGSPHGDELLLHRALQSKKYVLCSGRAFSKCCAILMVLDGLCGFIAATSW